MKTDSFPNVITEKELLEKFGEAKKKQMICTDDVVTSIATEKLKESKN